MATDLEIKQRITEKARDWFFQFGFSKVTMDELATELGMSKKTLYKYFTSKEQLLWEIYKITTDDFKSSAENIYADTKTDFVDKLALVLQKNCSTTSQWSKTFLTDIQKHARDIWEEVEKFRKESIMGRFGKFFSEGVANGFFRNDIDQNLTLIIYTRMIQGIINPDVLSQIPYSAAQVYDAIIKIVYEGVLTDAGREQYRAKLKENAGVSAATVNLQ
jgi:AcrR family transcriptional regulator